MDQLINENYHNQVFKKSFPIFEFLYKQQMLQQKEIDSIWSSIQSKHEVDLRVIYSVLAELAGILSPELLNHFYSQIKKIPIEKFEDYLITLIQDFTIKA